MSISWKPHNGQGAPEKLSWARHNVSYLHT